MASPGSAVVQLALELEVGVGDDAAGAGVDVAGDDAADRCGGVEVVVLFLIRDFRIFNHFITSLELVWQVELT